MSAAYGTGVHLHPEGQDVDGCMRCRVRKMTTRPAQPGDPIDPVLLAGIRGRRHHDIPLSPTEVDALLNEIDRLTDGQTSVIDETHLERQRQWSRATFGPGRRLGGVLAHIRKELVEIEKEPLDVGEWVDVVILALDGAWRAGHEPAAIIAAIRDKQARNEARAWPDWRDSDEDHAIEHVR